MTSVNNVSIDYIHRLLAAFDDDLIVQLQNERLVPKIGRKLEVPTELTGHMLTERELEALYLILSGATNHEISEAMVIANSTVKRHINNLYSKLNIHSRTQLLHQARTWKFVPYRVGQ